MNKETAKTYVAWCPIDGIPLHEAHTADGWDLCPECRKLYRVIIKEGKVTVIEDHMLGVNQSAILRWVRGIRYAARRRLDTTLVMQ